MTEKPQAVVTDLTDFALDMHADCCGCVRKEATHTARFVVWLAKIEAQAKREGAREAEAALIAAYAPRCRQCGKRTEPQRWCYAVPTCYACLPPPNIRALAAEPEVKP